MQNEQTTSASEDVASIKNVKLVNYSVLPITSVSLILYEKLIE